MAKESVVSVMEILFGSQGGVSAVLTPISAGALLIFSLLYTPCVAAVASIKRELGVKWAGAVIIWQCTVAWIVAFIFKLVIGLFF
jgi:ferrous iron transport protein B